MSPKHRRTGGGSGWQSRAGCAGGGRAWSDSQAACRAPGILCRRRA